MKFSNRNRLTSILSIFALCVPALAMHAKKPLDDAGDDAGGGGGTGTKKKPAAKKDDDAGGDEDVKDETDDTTEDDDGEDDEVKEPVVKKKHYDTVHKEARRRKEENAKLKKELEALQGSVPTQEELDEFREYKANKAKEQEEVAKKKGQFDKILADKESKHKADLEAAKKAAQDADARWRSEKIDNLLAFEIPKHTRVPTEDVAPLLRKFISINDEGKVVINVNGEWPINEAGDEMTPAEFIGAEIAKRPHFASLKPSGGSGSSTTAGRGGKGGKFTPKDIDAMSDEEYEKHRAAIHEQARVPSRGYGSDE